MQSRSFMTLLFRVRSPLLEWAILCMPLYWITQYTAPPDTPWHHAIPPGNPWHHALPPGEPQRYMA